MLGALGVVVHVLEPLELIDRHGRLDPHLHEGSTSRDLLGALVLEHDERRDEVRKDVEDHHIHDQRRDARQDDQIDDGGELLVHVSSGTSDDNVSETQRSNRVGAV